MDPTFYNGPVGMITVPDDGEHVRMRRAPAPGFTNAELKEQEELSTRYGDWSMGGFLNMRWTARPTYTSDSMQYDVRHHG